MQPLQLNFDWFSIFVVGFLMTFIVLGIAFSLIRSYYIFMMERTIIEHLVKYFETKNESQ